MSHTERECNINTCILSVCQAREQYDDAVSSGQQAFLLEESEESVDMFKMSVGSLPPGQSAAVTFIYITELSVQADHSLQFCLPAVLNPRYTPAGTKHTHPPPHTLLSHTKHTLLKKI